MLSNSHLLRKIPRPIIQHIRNLYLLFLDSVDYISGRKDSLTPPRSLHYVGGGDFKAIGRSFLSHFINICQIKPGDRILDIGCGTGRMAVPLLDFLNSSGTYCGFDISRRAIQWCQEHITAKKSHFTFIHADILNREYNPGGKIPAADFIFPCEDESIDFAFATSVFTHMRSAEVAQYLSEIRRCLTPQGVAMLTFYLLDDQSGSLMQQGKSHMNFHVKLEDCYSIESKTPERAIAFSKKQLMMLLDQTKLVLADQIYWGGWSGRKSKLEFQDVIIVKKK